MLIHLLACSAPTLDPASREPQAVEAPFGVVVALLPSPDGPVLVTSRGAVRLGDRITPIELPPEPPITAAALGPDGTLVLAREGDAPGGEIRAIGAGPVGPPGEPFLMGVSGDVAVGGGPGPHGAWDGRVVSLPDRREVWIGGPEWEVLHAIAPLGDGWLAAGVGLDRKGAVEVAGAVWVVALDPALAPRWERRFHGGQDHVAAVVGLGERAVVLALGGNWDDHMKPLSGWVVRADGSSAPLGTDLGRVRSVAATAAGPGRILLATTDQAGHHFVRWVDVP